MKKSFKSCVIFVILIFMFCTAVSAAYGWEDYNYSRFDKNTYIYDIGGNFKDIDLEYYNGVLKDMKAKYGITYVFVIVNDYNITRDDDNAWELAALIHDKAGYDKDCIFAARVLGPGERDVGVFTSGQGQAVMNDSYVDGMLDALTVDLLKGDQDGALLTFIDLSEKMTVSYNDDTKKVTDRHGNTIYYDKDYKYSDRDDSYTEWDYKDHYTFIDFMPVRTVVIVSIAIGLVISLIAMFVELGKHKPVKKAVTADYYVKEENVKMTVATDTFLRSHETRVRVSSDSSGGGGGRSGGSTHTGSSGRSGGGGSRRV